MKARLNCLECHMYNCGCDDEEGQWVGGCVIPWEPDNGPVEMITLPETQEVETGTLKN